MGILSAFQMAEVAIGAIDKLIDMFPNFEQKQINQWRNLKEAYETEKTKPRYNPDKTPQENEDARSEDRLLNLRDKCVLYGETLVKSIGSGKG